MRVNHEDALICDFAQYYNIYDFDQISISKAAVLACGLPENSRVMRKLSGTKIEGNRIIQISILDTLKSIEYALFQAHSKKKLKKPKSVLQKILNGKPTSDIRGYRTPEEFETARRRIIEESKNE